MTQDSTLMHATTVAIDGQGVLIFGPSGSGKSGLALQLIALGAVLVADDQTQLAQHADQVVATAPPTIAGLIEARGVGLIRLPVAGPTPVALTVDLGQLEEHRLPLAHTAEIAGHSLPCLHKVASPHFPSAILAYIKGTMET